MTNFSPNWIVLFGGAGREESVFRMIREGLDVRKILVPIEQSLKLSESIDAIQTTGCEVVEVDRTGISSALEVSRGGSLISIGFPYLISESDLNWFSVALNVHPTLLPKYRGATSGPYILINDENETGVTVHLMTSGMDRGDIVYQKSISISKFDTIRSIQRKNYAIEPDAIVEAIHCLERGDEPTPQDENQATEFPGRRVPEDSEIDPSESLSKLYNTIRACDPLDYPAFFWIEGQKVCVHLWRPDKPESELDMI